MTIDEAIKRLREDTEHPTAKYMPDLLQAQILGIEALQYISDYCEDSPLLPSETEDK